MRTGDVFAALGVGLLVFFAAALAFGARGRNSVVSRLRAHIPELDAPKESRAERRPVLSPLIAAADRAISSAGIRRRLEGALERAGSDLSPAQLSLIMGGSALAPVFLLRLSGLPTGLALLAFPLGGLLPYAVLRHQGARRQRAFDEQLPDLLMTMAASARVGHTFRQSMQTVVTEGEEPAASEFRRVLVETDLGRPLERALAEMAERLSSRNFAYVVNVVTIQREVGGSLAGLFDLVAETVRQRQQFTKKVKGLTAMGRLSAYVLVGLPFVIGLGMTAINHNYMAPLFTSSTGRTLLIVALVGIGLGSLLLKKIVSFRLE